MYAYLRCNAENHQKKMALFPIQILMEYIINRFKMNLSV